MIWSGGHWSDAAIELEINETDNVLGLGCENVKRHDNTANRITEDFDVLVQDTAEGIETAALWNE